jgi:lactate racemase
VSTTSTAEAFLVGAGQPDFDLSADELRDILSEALSTVPAGARVLAIVADKTRDDNTSLLFPLAAHLLADRRIAKFDALIAQGTHRPMSDGEKRQKVGALANSLPGLGHIFDHDWADPGKLVTIGELSATRMREITGGLIEKSIRLNVNRLLAPGVYDTVLIFGATVPHEVAGFSGGAKYFFPGVSGPELTHATHWLSALSTIENVIGLVETPPRHLFEAAADFVPARVISLNSVVTRPTPAKLRTHGLFCGDFRLAIRRAAEVSRYVHIKYTGRKYKRVIALLDEHLNDLWVGGKASYRLGRVIEEGGELIIYAPHVTCISEVHGELIQRYGYRPLEKIRELVAQSPELQQNLCVAAHLAHVSFAGRRSADGEIVPRYAITLASGIDQATCRQVKLGYMDPLEFRRDDYEGDADTLIVEQAGRDLYLVRPLET